jgi:hypothetical protein
MSTPSINIASDVYKGFEELEPLTPLLRHAMPIVPELPHSMALDMLRQKYIDFARRTRILQTEIPIQYQSGVRDYQLDAPEGWGWKPHIRRTRGTGTAKATAISAKPSHTM